MADPTYRMSMLPFGTYANPDGTESLGLAVPGMIQEPINALMRLAENSRLPDGRLGIPNPDNAQNRDDVLTGLLSMYGGNAMKGVAREAAALPSLRDTAQGIYRDVKYGNEPSPVLKGKVLAGAEYAYPATVHPAFDPPPMAGILERGPANDTLFGSLYDVPPVEGPYGAALIDQARKSYRPELRVVPPSLPPHLDDFARKGFAQREGASVTRDDAYQSYLRWADQNGINAVDVAPFVRSMSENGLTTQRIAGQPRYIGVESLYSDTGRPSLFGSAIAGAERPSFGQPTQAASYYNGELFTGRNHGEAYSRAVAKYGEDAVDRMITRDGMLDGFVDQHGNFMDRLTANEISGGKGLHAYQLFTDTGRPSLFASSNYRQQDEAPPTEGLGALSPTLPRAEEGLGALGTYARGGVVSRLPTHR